ncbi:hypothetical protein, partial [Nostoc sp.]|uniref:hypothetical protein n=1 Tax=Nostoc sp. TaxID=1180 RepID=UPI002FFBEB21
MDWSFDLAKVKQTTYTSSIVIKNININTDYLAFYFVTKSPYLDRGSAVVKLREIWWAELPILIHLNKKRPPFGRALFDLAKLYYLTVDSRSSKSYRSKIT